MSIVIVEGNIAAGKTTLCSALSALGFVTLLEPTVTNPYLGRFYDDPKKYALPMQMWLLRQRYRTYMEALKCITKTEKSVVLDRSIWSDWVFAEKNRLDGNITEEGFEFYLSVREKLLANLPVPGVTLYLDVDPKECYTRIHKLRRRDEEECIPLAYLEGLHSCYHSFISSMEDKGSNVVRMSWSSFGSSEDVSDRISKGAGPADIASLRSSFHRLQAVKDLWEDFKPPETLFDGVPFYAETDANAENTAMAAMKEKDDARGAPLQV